MVGNAVIASSRSMAPPDVERTRATRRWAAALAGDDPDQVPGALVAVATLPDPAFVPGLLALAGTPSPPAELPDALSANANSMADSVDAALSGKGDLTWPAVRRLVAALGESQAAMGRCVLVPHIGHPDPEVADAVLDALLVGGPVRDEQEEVVRAGVGAEVQRASRMLAALDVLEGHPGVEHVMRGLADEVARAARRTTGLLCLLAGDRGHRRQIAIPSQPATLMHLHASDVRFLRLAGGDASGSQSSWR